MLLVRDKLKDNKGKQQTQKQAAYNKTIERIFYNLNQTMKGLFCVDWLIFFCITCMDGTEKWPRSANMASTPAIIVKQTSNYDMQIYVAYVYTQKTNYENKSEKKC